MNISRHAIKVGVFGSDGDHCSELAYSLALNLGRLLARRGAIIFTGGGSGVMEAASRGAAEAGGISIGILPTAAAKKYANPYLWLAVPSGIGFARSQIITNTVDAGVLIEGGLGTREEAGQLYWHKKPIVALRHSGGTAAELADKYVDRRELVKVIGADTVEDAVGTLYGCMGSFKESE